MSLDNACSHMLTDGLDADTAAFEVGYAGEPVQSRAQQILLAKRQCDMSKRTDLQASHQHATDHVHLPHSVRIVATRKLATLRGGKDTWR